MTLSSTKVQFALALAILFCIVIAIWLPFSFNISPIWDGWGIYHMIDVGRAPFIRVDVEAMRPFTNVSWYLAYAIDSTSFVGVTAVLITLFVAKGAACYLVIRRIFPKVTAAFALAVAAIVTAHPGDPHALYPGSIGGHLGIFLFLMSVYLLLVFVENGRWPILVASLAYSLLSMGFSERTYPMVVLTPLLVFYKTGKLNRRALMAIGGWLAVATPVFVLYGVSFLSDSYKRLDRVAGGSFNPITLFERTIHAFQQVFIEGWILPSANVTPSWLLFALSVSFVLAVTLVFFQRDETAPTQPPRRLLLLAIVGGLVVVAAGFAAFAPLEQYGTALKRALYLSVFGGALALASLLCLITSYLPAKRYLFPVSVSMAVCLGILNLQFQQQQEYSLAIKQHTIIATIIEAVPAPRSDTALFVVFSDANMYESARFASPDGFQNALSVLYGYPVKVCESGVDTNIICELTSDGLQVKISRENQSKSGPAYPYENLIGVRFEGRGKTIVMTTEQLIEFAPDNTVTQQIAQRYNPHSLFSADDPFPSRYHTLLLSEVTAPLDTLPLMTEALALSPFSKVVAPQGNEPFILIEGEGLTAAEHLGYPQQNALETDGEHSWLWLGDGVQQGVTFYLQADTPLTAQLALAVKPGPSRDDQTRTLEIRNLQTDAVSVITFDEQTTVTSDAIALDAGLNPIQLTVLETPDTTDPNGDPRSLLVLLDSVLVTTHK